MTAESDLKPRPLDPARLSVLSLPMHEPRGRGRGTEPLPGGRIRGPARRPAGDPGRRRVNRRRRVPPVRPRHGGTEADLDALGTPPSWAGTPGARRTRGPG